MWLVRRPDRAMLGGMRALPDDGWTASRDGHGKPPLPGEWRDCGAVRHSFTHVDLTLRVLRHAEGALSPPGEGEWWPVEELEAAGLPTLFAKAAGLVRAR